MNNSRVVPGAKTAQRALRVLKFIAVHNGDAVSAVQIQEALGEERSSVQRALQSLLEEGFIQRRADHRFFQLGVEAVHLGRATFRQSPLVSRYQFAMQRIARMTGDTVFLSMQVGDFIVCLHRDEGSHRVRAPRTRVGDFRVLGTTAGGMAMLATWPDADIWALHGRHRAAFEQARMSEAALRRNVAHVRAHGFALVSDNVSEGVTSVGVVLGGEAGAFAVAAISSATQTMTDERVASLYRLLSSALAEPPPSL